MKLTISYNSKFYQADVQISETSYNFKLLKYNQVHSYYCVYGFSRLSRRTFAERLVEYKKFKKGMCETLCGENFIEIK